MAKKARNASKEEKFTIDPISKTLPKKVNKGAVVPVTISSASTAPSDKLWKVSDFKGADYNPRYISETRLKHLKRSIETFGDLSGVVFNRRTKRLVSGHQRLKTIADVKTSVITKPHTDKHGTIEVGHIVAHTANGAIRIPIRIVDWNEDRVEKAANIAANSHGGDFDRKKLREVLKSLDTNTFDIEVLGLDPVTISGIMLPYTTRADKEDTERKTSSFQEFGTETFKLKHCCPRCNFLFDKSADGIQQKKEGMLVSKPVKSGKAVKSDVTKVVPKKGKKVADKSSKARSE